MQKIFMIANRAAGGKNEHILTQIETDLRERKIDYDLIPIQNDKKCEEAVKNAAEQDGTVIAAGGDGSVNRAAGLCYQYKARMGVIPLGTFNYFAREIGIPLEPLEALKIALEGKEINVSIGLANDRVFLNNASAGLYCTLIREREAATASWGRMRMIGAVSAFISLLRGGRPRRMIISKDNVKEQFKTSLLFVGHNKLQLGGLGLNANIVNCKDTGQLGAVIMKPSGRFEILRMILKSAVKSLDDERIIHFCHHDFTVTTARKRIDFVIDGEIFQENSPIRFKMQENALRVMAPAEAA